MSDSQKILVPDVGGDEVEIIEICFAVGDDVEADEGIITVETDKASMDIPAPFSGKLSALLVNVGDKIKEGDVIAEMTSSSATSEEAPVVEEAQEATPVAEEAKETPAPGKATEPPVDSVSTESEIIEITVPDIGEDGEVEVIDVLVNVGDVIEIEDGLITLETDKATMDVPSSHAGTVKEVFVSVGGKVKQGSIVIKLETSSGSPIEAPAPAPEKEVEAPKAKPAPAVAAVKAAPVPHHPQAGKMVSSGSIYTSPSIRRIAREFGVDLTLVKGMGRKGRILKEDVQSYVKYELSRPKANAGSSVAAGEGGLQVVSAKAIDFSKFGEIETKALTRIQKISGPFLHRNWVTIPHVTQFDEADITNVEAFRKEQNVICEKKKLGFKITPLVFILKAAADALREFPTFNSSLSEDGESLILKKYIHIGVAVDTPNGLVVPVVRDVDQKGIHQLSRELLEISMKARDGKLKATDMQGGCFTISSLGGIGGTAFTPIVNAPEVAILGVSKSEMKPKWNGKDFEPKLMLPLSMSYDHRVIDGALAARFTVHLASVMSDIRQLIL
ncbi:MULTISPECIES: dihydrolipoyllysine-residue acetyltransferase [unclassified Colwellia]|uniref:dihydrolipoyllysine-residue acetyltransferase n=1 Tax=unclassified Colwellia TaxID=196834 RepID=UPI0015F693F8|nr:MULTISPECIES: dihydrolipoyllysine-residue acetyltransferase [unclassified Colwellia]MBA6232469.1 dihydrolipoyllysine-residue acetyltransferase [Colwellia sp. MB02u-7]MBA6237694.1 dihydrolipoyllysine-residue acetyltransferase [Colwellia sp. MB02u-11]MBA6299537.1 dihydrolipoyllysine-residue acetyltransferase [Colwellia sp. MB3u-22]MBA6303705.1 dihydrolipoyllysine-residue acetyltransferase [Colwellia sp. MB02u-14]MBA6313108.1 dihydrolipoyllysine-residue acetyltransferase [Colwellia sp. MB3u-64